MGLNAPGRLSAGVQATRVMHYVSQSTALAPELENVGYSNLPKWRITSRLGYSLDAFNAGLSWRYQSSVMSGARQTNPASPTLGGPWYGRFDASAGYTYKSFEVNLAISNLLDKNPPRYGYNPWQTGAGTFLPGADLVGRRYTLSTTLRPLSRQEN